MVFKRKRKAAMPYSGAVHRGWEINAMLTLELARMRHPAETLTDEERRSLRALAELLHHCQALAGRVQRFADARAAPPAGPLLCPLRNVQCLACAVPCDVGN